MIKIHHLNHSRSTRVIWLMEELNEPYEIVQHMAQQVGRTYRLGVLLPHPRDVPINIAFLEEFRRRGFIEGQNLIVEWRPYWQHLDLISQYAAELVGARVDVIATGGEEALRAAQQATKTIPIVMRNK